MALVFASEVFVWEDGEAIGALPVMLRVVCRGEGDEIPPSLSEVLTGDYHPFKFLKHSAGSLQLHLCYLGNDPS